MNHQVVKLSDYDIYQLSQGRIFIGPSNTKSSIGYLELNPHQQLDKHNRPAPEELIQIKGNSTMVLFDQEDNPQNIILNQGGYLKIPAHIFHIHSNLNNRKSLTLWKFEGDITNIINHIKSNFPKL
jgi:quercetin dioxygenase-like cupin family protein